MQWARRVDITEVLSRGEKTETLLTMNFKVRLLRPMVGLQCHLKPEAFPPDCFLISPEQEPTLDKQKLTLNNGRLLSQH